MEGQKIWRLFGLLFYRNRERAAEACRIDGDKNQLNTRDIGNTKKRKTFQNPLDKSKECSIIKSKDKESQILEGEGYGKIIRYY